MEILDFFSTYNNKSLFLLHTITKVLTALTFNIAAEHIQVEFGRRQNFLAFKKLTPLGR